MTLPDAGPLVAALKERGLSLCVAESCTGGLLGAAITAVPGASAAFRGGILAYGNEVKQQALGVEAEMLERFGAVSGAVVEAMADGVRQRMHSDVAIAVSGVAGPGGGSSGKDIGTVWIAVLGPEHLLDVHRVHIEGDRDAVRRGAVEEAIAMALDVIGEAKAEGKA